MNIHIFKKFFKMLENKQVETGKFNPRNAHKFYFDFNQIKEEDFEAVGEIAIDQKEEIVISHNRGIESVLPFTNCLIAIPSFWRMEYGLVTYVFEEDEGIYFAFTPMTEENITISAILDKRSGDILFDPELNDLKAYDYSQRQKDAIEKFKEHGTIYLALVLFVITMVEKNRVKATCNRNINSGAKTNNKMKVLEKAPNIVYKVLKLGIPNINRTLNNNEKESYNQKMHWRRGHWRNQHTSKGIKKIRIAPYVAGNPALGIIIKDYDIHSDTKI